jgi:hypothetical protein
MVRDMKRIAVASLFCFAACSTTTPQHGGTGGSGGNIGGVGGSGGSGGSGGNGNGGNGGGGGDDCSDAAKLVYVIDTDTTLYSFKPNQTDVTKSTFTPVGMLKCDTGGILSPYQPFSMSVDRNAVAWVEYGDQFTGKPNLLFSVSTTDASCTSTQFKGGQANFGLFGMGFVSDAAQSSAETLFIAGTEMVGSGSSELGTLDLASFGIKDLNASLMGNPELTGTGLGDLWGFFPDKSADKVRISKIDKTSGAESGTIKLGATVAGTGGAWAFAFWGGDFWVFLQKQNEQSTTVYHVTPTGLKDSWTNTGKHIVGAGVSTCAPTGPIT